MTELTYWNGLPVPATRGTAVVADAVGFPQYWAKLAGLVGQRIPVARAEINADRMGSYVVYIDDRDSAGWAKLTEGRSFPRMGYSNVEIEPDSFEEVVPRPSYLFKGDRTDPRTLAAVLMKASSAIAVCWSNPEGAGVFSQETADEIIKEVHGWVDDNYILGGVDGRATEQQSRSEEVA